MTEAEWRASDNVPEMLEALRQIVPDYEARLERKLHLYYLACCRAIWKLLPDEGSRMAVEIAERYLEGQATDEELSDADWHAEGAKFNIRFNGDPEAIERWVQETRAIPEAEFRLMIHLPEAVFSLETRELLKWAANFANFAVIYSWIEPKGPRPSPKYAPFLSASLLRDIVGNPFREFSIAPPVLSWNDGCVVKLATSIYQERAFDRMPILGDALEDAGCGNAEIIQHCREQGTDHVRGCWLIDLLLGKA